MKEIRIGKWYKVIDKGEERVKVQRPYMDSPHIYSISVYSPFKVIDSKNGIATCMLRNNRYFRISTKLIDTSITYNY